jgi:hypothetical protein
MCVRYHAPLTSTDAEHCVPSVSCPHKLHFHLLPPDIHLHHGLTKPLHFSHLAGPASPVSTNGTGSSKRSSSAKGWKTATIGIEQSEASRDVAGTFHVDTRTNLGEELPVGYMRYNGYTQSRRVPTLVNRNVICCRQRCMTFGMCSIRVILPLNSVCLNHLRWGRYGGRLDSRPETYDSSSDMILHINL